MKTAILLAILQAATEFLPVSSSGHLALFSNVIAEPDIFFFTVLHLASLLAVIIFTRREIKELFSFSKGARAMWGYLAAAALPACVFGFFLRGIFEPAFGSLASIGVAFIITGVILFLTRFARRRAALNIKNALFIGIFQVLGLFPGISRSGMTISAGLFLGIEPEKAAKFSFLLFIPLSLGAFALEATNGAYFNVTLLVSFFVCLFASLLFLKALFTLVKKGRLWFFSFYCVLIGCLALFLAGSRAPETFKKSGTAYAESSEKLTRQDLPIEVSDKTWALFEEVQRVAPMKIVFDPGRAGGKIPQNISAQFVCSPKNFEIFIVLYDKYVEEETLAHEALHALYIVRGFPFFVRRAFPEKNTMANLENQIEHMSIFPEMGNMGFNPGAYAQKRWRSGVETIGRASLLEIPSDTPLYVTRAIVATYTLGGLVAGIDRKEIEENIPPKFAGFIGDGVSVYEALERYDLTERGGNLKARTGVASILGLKDRDAFICEMDFKNRKLKYFGVETGKTLRK